MSETIRAALAKPEPLGDLARVVTSGDPNACIEEWARRAYDPTLVLTLHLAAPVYPGETFYLMPHHHILKVAS